MTSVYHPTLARSHRLSSSNAGRLFAEICTAGSNRVATAGSTSPTVP